jgi:anti-sigma factor RsiW
MTDNRHYADEAAAYVLGALEPDEALDLERHIAYCDACRQEVDQLRGAVATFAATAPALSPRRRVRRRLLREVRQDARASSIPHPGPTRTARLSLAAAILAIAVAAFVVGGEQGGHGPRSRVVTAGVGDASVRITGKQAELIVVRLPRAPDGRTYEIWLERGSSPPQASTLFNVNARGRSEVAVDGSIEAVRRLLVTEEPSGGTAQPTTRPVIVATIS